MTEPDDHVEIRTLREHNRKLAAELAQAYERIADLEAELAAVRADVNETYARQNG